ncbi:trafficking protein particle complex subunit 5-like isoform X4 [Amborella trichopoda]|uniref:trafficking protein particle complex subunit 5-like isoform X4 n=1 Tax=Amborella trichopoda TaxID=13333 RepID=UPI0009C0CC23|nr:trafficking protein particle complex subunit 5-like isoform X4 [Amborella trichopoda]|eukprot:XP_020530658.1 trafficking protein particle complex subunit 5-like isoform X4 [Amborella trichopoda]
MSSSPTFSLLVCLPLWHCGEVTANHAELESLLQGLLIYMERGIEIEDEYIISEKELLVNSFISIPYDMGTFNCGAFVAGIVRPYRVSWTLNVPATVSAYLVPMEGQQRPRTTILIKFADLMLNFNFSSHCPKRTIREARLS